MKLPKYKYVIILNLVLLICIGILIFFDSRDNIKFDKFEKEYYKEFYIEKGRIIGRNAMFQYLHEVNELNDTSININIKMLDSIENKIENKLLKNRKNSDER
jgi:hypothetical protein